MAAINGLLRVVRELDWSLKQIFENFGEFWRKITSDSQMRWVGGQVTFLEKQKLTASKFLPNNEQLILTFACLIWPSWFIFITAWTREGSYAFSNWSFSKRLLGPLGKN